VSAEKKSAQKLNPPIHELLYYLDVALSDVDGN